MIKIPEKIKYVLDRINNSGFEAYIVGGCVRDAIMGREPNDWDITTSAEPEAIKDIFEKTVDTGIKHGTVTVLIDKEHIEVTTYRIDGEYLDNRRPEEVEFTKKIEDDLKRRDFTINAIAYNEKNGYVDLYGGMNDIKNKIVKCVGNPDERFNEDGLRMLRAIRFSAQLDFKIDEVTLKSIKKNNELIKNISAERVREELTKILLSDNPERLMVLYATDIMKHILPEFERAIGFEQDNPYHKYNVADHTMEAIKKIDKDAVLRWTMLLHDFGKPLTKTFDEKGIGHFYGHSKVSENIARNVLNRLKFDNNSIKKITRLIKNHDYRIGLTEKGVRKVVAKVGEDIFLDLLKVQKADDAAKSEKAIKEHGDKPEKVKEIYNQILEKNQCMSIDALKINGKDLLDLGVEQGKKIGEILDYLFEKVIDNPDLNDKEKLLELAEKKIGGIYEHKLKK